MPLFKAGSSRFRFVGTIAQVYSSQIYNVILCNIQLDPLIRTRLFRISRYFELKTISLVFSLIKVIYYRLFRTILRFHREFEGAGFTCILIS